MPSQPSSLLKNTWNTHSLEGLPLLLMWRLLPQVSLSSLMSHCHDSSFRIKVLIAALCRQFWTALAQTNISGLFVLGASTSMPEHPSWSKKNCFLWLAQFCFQHWFFKVIVHILNWSVCHLLRKVSRASQNCFLLPLFDGVLPDLQDFCVICNFYGRTSASSFDTFALSTTASVVSLFGMSRSHRALSASHSFSTIDALAERFPPVEA